MNPLKFKKEDKEAIGFFVKNGYLIYKKLHDKKLIDASRSWFFKQIKAFEKSSTEKDLNGWAASIIDSYRLTNLGNAFANNKNIVEIMQQFLGPDIAIFNQDALWINAPKDNDPVLLKGIHTDAWSGTSVNTIFCKTFFTDVDKYNGMSVCPCSHLYGLVPVRNREVDQNSRISPNVLNLCNIKAGDVLMWHPLLLHSTTGHSDKNIRISITSRFTSTETPFSSQERALGYQTLSVGPMNQILRLIGNDNLLPFRTLGGFVGVDRRLKDLYNYSDYRK